MCNETGGRHGKCSCHHGSSCDRDGPFRFARRFWTEEEHIARLEEYLESLQAETSAVGERIAELKKEK